MRYFTPQERRGFSLSRVLSGMNSEAGLTGCLEAEILADSARDLGQGYDSHRVNLPLQLLTRDLTVAGDGAGLVATDTIEPFAPLSNFSAAARLGAVFLPNLVGNVDIPVLAITGGTWQNGENDAVDELTPATAAAQLRPKTVGVIVDFTRRMKLQSAIDAVLSRHLLVKLGNLIDAAVIDGSGLSGQPTGILNANGVGSVDGTDFTWADALSMEASCATASGELCLAFLGHPDARQLLATRAKGTDAGFVWADRRISDTDAFVSASVPSKALLCGPWSSVYIGTWGQAVTLEIDPYSNFKNGLLSARMMIDMDVGLPGAVLFSKSESLT